MDDLVRARERVERLEEALRVIAFMADGHKRATLYLDGENAALTNIRNLAITELGLAEDFERVTSGSLRALIEKTT